MFKTLVLLASLLLLSPIAQASTCSSAAVCKTGFVSFTNAVGTSALSIYTATGNGAKITSIFCSSTQPTNAPVLSISTLHSAVSYPMWSVGLSAVSGQNTGTVNNALTATLFNGSGNTNPFNTLPVDENGNPYILLAAGDALQLNMQTAVTSPYVIDCYAFITQY